VRRKILDALLFSLCSFAVFLGSLAVLAPSVLAQDHGEEERPAIQSPDEAPDPIDRWDIAAWDHFELSMGFIAGVRSYESSSFALDSEARVSGATDLVDPFTAPPFDALTTLGLRYDLRLVAAYTRMTVGIDIPFAQYQPTIARGTYVVDGVERSVAVKSISPFLLHLGIGAEIPIGPIAPFVDVLGHVRWTQAELSIDGMSHDYAESGFGFSARAGVRLHVRRWFFASLSGEVGLIGDFRWGGELSVGFAIM
jgi:hypothetical protein